ncbi:MAG: BBE domain-containing protein, partial [Dehalococcoidia bacterium]
WIGDAAEGEKKFEPLRTFAEPYADLTGPVPYLDLQKLFDADYPKGGRYYWKSTYLDGLNDGAIDELIALTLERPSAESTLDVWQLGGAIARVPEDGTAYPHRKAEFLLGIEANWHHAEDDSANRDWARDVFKRMQPYSYRDAGYVNFPGDLEEGDAGSRKAYWPNYERLQRIKKRYDPDNVFRLNTNIEPSL